MREIGGYFGLETFSGREYYPDLIAVNNGRSGLLWLLKARKIQKLYIPYFLCDSVSGVCDREGFRYSYYAVDRDFMPVLDRKMEPGEYIYIVNYYGQITNETAVRLKARYGNIIFDNVQAFFQQPVPGIDTIYSCRKFFGVPDGGYISTDAVLSELLERDVSMDRMRHILGRFEGTASDYHQYFKANDRDFVTLPLREMSHLTHNLLRAIDYEQVKQRREDNFALLHDSLGTRSGLRPIRPEGPYAYPFYCENGMEVKKRLALKKIYVATLWPNVLQTEMPVEKDYAENILPLPCDQRYGPEEMARIAEEVISCID